MPAPPPPPPQVGNSDRGREASEGPVRRVVLDVTRRAREAKKAPGGAGAGSKPDSSSGPKPTTFGMLVNGERAQPVCWSNKVTDSATAHGRLLHVFAVNHCLGWSEPTCMVGVVTTHRG